MALCRAERSQWVKMGALQFRWRQSFQRQEKGGMFKQQEGRWSWRARVTGRQESEGSEEGRRQARVLHTAKFTVGAHGKPTERKRVIKFLF